MAGLQGAMQGLLRWVCSWERLLALGWQTGAVPAEVDVSWKSIPALVVLYGVQAPDPRQVQHTIVEQRGKLCRALWHCIVSFLMCAGS